MFNFRISTINVNNKTDGEYIIQPCKKSTTGTDMVRIIKWKLSQTIYNYHLNLLNENT